MLPRPLFILVPFETRLCQFLLNQRQMPHGQAAIGLPNGELFVGWIPGQRPNGASLRPQ